MDLGRVVHVSTRESVVGTAPEDAAGIDGAVDAGRAPGTPGARQAPAMPAEVEPVGVRIRA